MMRKGIPFFGMRYKIWKSPAMMIYPNFFFYIPGILRVFHVSILSSYRFLLLAVQIATPFIEERKRGKQVKRPVKKRKRREPFLHVFLFF